MPLVQCPECQKDVSSEAVACPQCAFPYPGKKERFDGKGVESLQHCVDCGNILSKQAKACPHCGSPTSQAQELPESTARELGQETWLCPHCGIPFTRRLKGGKGKIGATRPQQLVASSSGQITGQEENGARIAEARQELIDTYAQKVEKKKRPLWGESPRPREEEPQYPRARKKMSLLVVVIVSVLLVAIASFAFFQLQGLNPLEALVYWQM